MSKCDRDTEKGCEACLPRITAGHSRLHTLLGTRRSHAFNYGAKSLAALRSKLGAGETCHLIADASDMDGQTMALPEALWRASAHGVGVVLSCLPGRLCFHKPEAPTTGLILEKPRGLSPSGAKSHSRFAGH